MLKNKLKNIWLLSLLVLVLCTIGFIAKAAGTEYIFEVGIPGIKMSNIHGIGDLVNSIVTVAYRIAMLFALYKIIEIGFKYMTNKGNSDVMAEISKGMKNVLIGILILFGSYIILHTINPDLTKLPNNINCVPGEENCDYLTGSKSGTDQYYVTCPAPALKDAVGGAQADDDLESQYSTSDKGITSQSIQAFIDQNSDSIYKSPDWAAALADLKTGKVSNNIWEAFMLLFNNKKSWLDETICSGKIEPGPILNGHKKDGDYISCHDSYEAIDFVLRDRNGNARSEEAKECMLMALRYLNTLSNVKVCDETMFEPPHIHLQDIKCDIPCKTK